MSYIVKGAMFDYYHFVELKESPSPSKFCHLQVYTLLPWDNCSDVKANLDILSKARNQTTAPIGTEPRSLRDRFLWI
jgi:hypothetical protein